MMTSVQEKIAEMLNARLQRIVDPSKVDEGNIKLIAYSLMRNVCNILCEELADE